VTLLYNELQLSTYVEDKRLQWARGLPVFIADWRLHASGNYNFEQHLLNVNISMTAFHKNIYFILGFFKKTGKTRVSHRVKMMTR